MHINEPELKPVTEPCGDQDEAAACPDGGLPVARLLVAEPQPSCLSLAGEMMGHIKIAFNVN